MKKSKTILLTQITLLPVLAAASLLLDAPSTTAQTAKYGASIRGEMHIPTEAECIDAMNTGTHMGLGRDGRYIVAKGEFIYWLDITPTYVDCTAARFAPQSD